MSQTIKDAKIAHAELESRILGLLKTFERDTGMRVVSIDLRRIEELRGSSVESVSVGVAL